MLTCTQYDNSIRWIPGERLNDLFEDRCDELANHLAVSANGRSLTYRQLDHKANQLARYLIKQGLQPGQRIGLLFDRSYHTYVALLAVLKINASYVPIDACFPRERIEYIVGDAEVPAIVTLSAFEEHVAGLGSSVICLDTQAQIISEESGARLEEFEVGRPEDDLCYIVYTSGSTGNPKGVAVEHPSICNFVKVAAETYGITQKDRVYQGMTIAFDFSVEELWVPLIAGATLIPGRSSLVGKDLADFLIDNQVTALCCVPTLLASIEQDIPQLRFLLVSGEACPQDLVTRWHRDDRVILNAYGPTEATVTATWTELRPEKPVTIGQPLPTYSIVILDVDTDETRANGSLGEICIAGIGLAKGYVNRDDLTEKAFIHDFVGMPNNPSQRIYRTGDLGRITEDGEIEFHGRIDTQVKIRGYRIELAEIESVLLELPEIAQAVVNTYSPEPGVKELVAFYTLREDVSEVSNEAIATTLRGRLPSYMVPAYVEQIDEIPMLPSNKADRKQLPDPSGPRFLARVGEFVDPSSDTEKVLASTLCEVLKIDRVSVSDHFFEDLGGHSLLMAQFCSKLRDRLTGSDVSMKDIYLQPTVAQLAECIDRQSQAKPSVKVPERPRRVPTTWEYYSCGLLQLIWYMVYGGLNVWIIVASVRWILGSVGAAELYLRITSFACMYFFGATAVAIAMKWMIVGRWKAEAIPIWSFAYFRFWMAKQFVQGAPMVMFKGSPLFNVYLRLMGAKIGRDVVIESKFVPVCTDLLTIGSGTVIRKESLLLGYKAQSNYLYTGPISVGTNSFVGVASSLDINTTMEDDTQLGHASALQEGQVVPKGNHYHGCPAEETNSNYCPVEPMPCSNLRKVLYSLLQLTSSLLVMTPAIIFPFYYWFRANRSAVPNILLTSAVLLFGSILLSFALVTIIPRILHLFVREGRTYVRYGFHHWVFGNIQGFSNSRFLNYLCGDSSFIVYYLRLIGYELNSVFQTGSNFGVEQWHDNPFLCDIGSGTMCADGLSMINVHMTSTSFRFAKASIGANNYLGNDVFYPPEGKTGDNCLLGTKVMIPVDGPVRENVGLLGSPCFEIPRAVDRDREFNNFADETTRRKRLTGKNWHNLFTLLSFLFVQWMYLDIIFTLGVAATIYSHHYGMISWLVYAGILPVFSILFFATIERASLRFGSMQPQIVSIYDRRFWQVERYWKHADPLMLMELFKGTPFKNIFSRAFGLRVGKRVFDNGLTVTEKTLVEIGDDCNLNEFCCLQSHSLEEGVFKSDLVKIGNGCTIGARALVHYGVTLQDNVVVEPDAFIMKGETAKSGTIWRGNPARGE